MCACKVACMHVCMYVCIRVSLPLSGSIVSTLRETRNSKISLWTRFTLKGETSFVLVKEGLGTLKKTRNYENGGHRDSKIKDEMMKCLEEWEGTHREDVKPLVL